MVTLRAEWLMAGDDHQPCPLCGSLLDSTDTQGLCPRCVVAQMLSPIDFESDTEAPEEELGEVGDHKILGRIAAGGMGVVYRAQQRGLGRIVALKLVLEGRLAGKQETDRFLFEAKAAAELEHPNIVPIYEVGEDNGQLYFTMRFIDGGDLADWGAAQRDPDRELDFRSCQTAAVKMMVKVARAVEFAHSKNILHRDLKPSNILVDRSDQPQITDFGLAKRLDVKSDLTQSGQIMGSPAFMAPEQAQGKAEPRSDLYSLGVILYQLLTNEVPFDGESPLDVIKHAAEQPPTPLHMHNQQIDRDLEVICLKCLEKIPEDRFTTVSDFADDLSRWLAGEPVQAAPLSRRKRLLRWAQRHPGRVAAAVAALCLLAIVSGSLLWRAEKTDERRRAELYATHVQLASDSIASLDWRTSEEALARAKELLPTDIVPIEWRLLASQVPSPLVSGAIPLTKINGLAIGKKAPLVFIVTTTSGDLAAWQVEEQRVLQQSSAPIGEPFYYNGGGDSLMQRDGAGLLRVVGKESVPAKDGNFIAQKGWAIAWTEQEESDRSIGENSVRGTVPGNARVRDFDVPFSGKLVAMAIDGERFLALLLDGFLEVWDVNKEPPQREVRIDHHFGEAKAIGFSPNGLRLATGANDGNVRIFGTRTGKLEATFPLGERPVAATAFFETKSKSGMTRQQLVAISTDGKFKVWDTAPQSSIGREVVGITGPIALSKDSKSFMGHGGLVDLTDPGFRYNESLPQRKLHGIGLHAGEAAAFVQSEDPRRIELLWWQIGSTAVSVASFNSRLTKNIATISPDGSRAVFIRESAFQIIDSRTGNILHEIDTSSRRCQTMDISNSSVAIHIERETVELYDLESGRQMPLKTSSRVQLAAFSNDGTRIALSDSSTISTFELNNGKWEPRQSIRAATDGPITWSASNSSLFIDNGRSMKIDCYNVESGQKLFHLNKRGRWQFLECTNDGTMLIAAEIGKTVIFSATVE